MEPYPPTLPDLADETIMSKEDYIDDFTASFKESTEKQIEVEVCDDTIILLSNEDNHGDNLIHPDQ